MNAVKIAERIEDELLNLLAIGDITDYKFDILNNNIHFYVYPSFPIEKANISIKIEM